MVDVRAGVDAVDAELVALIAERFGYMRAAARIKTARSAVRDEGRKAQVIANVVREAHLSGVPDPLPETLIADLWERLIEASIAYEMKAFEGR